MADPGPLPRPEDQRDLAGPQRGDEHPSLRQAARAWARCYSAQVGNTSSKVFDYGYVQALAQLQPSAAVTFQEELNKIVADIEAGNLTADELTRAREPALEALRRARETNDYWSFGRSDGVKLTTTPPNWNWRGEYDADPAPAHHRRPGRGRALPLSQRRQRGARVGGAAGFLSDPPPPFAGFNRRFAAGQLQAPPSQARYARKGRRVS